MSKRWDIITSKQKAEESKKTFNTGRNPMILEEENFPTKTAFDNIYERRKRRHVEIENSDGSQTGYKLLNDKPLQNLDSTHHIIPAMKLKNADNVSINKIPFEDRAIKHILKEKSPNFLSDLTKIPRDDALKIFAIDSLEKFLYLDERFIDTDRNISYGGVNPSKY